MTNYERLSLLKSAEQINPMSPAASGGFDVGGTNYKLDKGPQEELGPLPPTFGGGGLAQAVHDASPSFVSRGTLPGKPIAAQSNGQLKYNGGFASNDNKPMTPLNGLPGFAIGASRPSPQTDASGIPNGFPGFSPNVGADPFMGGAGGRMIGGQAGSALGGAAKPTTGMAASRP
jgi:hypothetical protein